MDGVAWYKKDAQKQNDKEPGKSIGYWLPAYSIKWYSGQSINNVPDLLQKIYKINCNTLKCSPFEHTKKR